MVIDINSFLEDLIDHPENFTSLEDVVNASVSVFEDTLKTLKTASPEERERIRENMVAHQQKIQEKLDALAKAESINVNELQEKLSDPANYSEAEWNSIVEMRKKMFDGFSDFLGHKTSPSKGDKKGGFSKKDWMSI